MFKNILNKIGEAFEEASGLICVYRMDKYDLEYEVPIYLPILKARAKEIILLFKDKKYNKIFFRLIMGRYDELINYLENKIPKKEIIKMTKFDEITEIYLQKLYYFDYKRNKEIDKKFYIIKHLILNGKVIKK